MVSASYRDRLAAGRDVPLSLEELSSLLAGSSIKRGLGAGGVGHQDIRRFRPPY